MRRSIDPENNNGRTVNIPEMQKKFKQELKVLSKMEKELRKKYGDLVLDIIEDSGKEYVKTMIFDTTLGDYHIERMIGLQNPNPEKKKAMRMAELHNSINTQNTANQIVQQHSQMTIQQAIEQANQEATRAAVNASLQAASLSASGGMNPFMFGMM